MTGSADRPWASLRRASCVLLCQDRTRAGFSAAADRRHHDLVAPAGAAVDFLAGAELHVFAHADPHLAQAPARAEHRNRRTAQTRIDLDEGLLDVAGGNGFRL